MVLPYAVVPCDSAENYLLQDEAALHRHLQWLCVFPGLETKIFNLAPFLQCNGILAKAVGVCVRTIQSYRLAQADGAPNEAHR